MSNTNTTNCVEVCMSRNGVECGSWINVNDTVRVYRSIAKAVERAVTKGKSDGEVKLGKLSYLFRTRIEQ
jgi:hypothetical protein